MNLPFSTGSPFGDLEANDRTPVRSNIKPETYKYLFGELLPYRGCQGEVVAYLLEKLCDHLKQRTDIGNFIGVDGKLRGLNDTTYIPTITRAIESFDFRFSHCGTDRPANDPHDTGTTAGPCDTTPPASDLATNSSCQGSSPTNLKGFFKAIAGSD